jgi:hypothetical protein
MSPLQTSSPSWPQGQAEILCRCITSVRLGYGRSLPRMDKILRIGTAYAPHYRPVLEEFCCCLDAAGAFDGLPPESAETAEFVIAVAVAAEAELGDPADQLRKRADAEPDPAVARALLVAAEAW